MKSKLTEIRKLLRSKAPGERRRFAESYRKAKEVILIGSYAMDSTAESSDVDILFVGRGKRHRGSSVDFIWIPERMVSSRSWLGSEFANHVSKYGIWLKGDGRWRTKVFFSKNAIRQKCERILVRFVRIYCKRDSIRSEGIAKLTKRCVLDMQRLLLLRDHIPAPSAAFVMKEFIKNPKYTFRAACEPELLGKLGAFFVRELVPKALVTRSIRTQLRQREKLDRNE